MNAETLPLPMPIPAHSLQVGDRVTIRGEGSVEQRYYIVARTNSEFRWPAPVAPWKANKHRYGR